MNDLCRSCNAIYRIAYERLGFTSIWDWQNFLLSTDGAIWISFIQIGFVTIYTKKIVSYWNKTYLFAANVVISAALSRVVRTSSQLLPPVIRCTELNETSSLEFFPLFATLLLDGAILCLDACLWRLSAKNSARTAFSFASLISTAVTCSNPWTFCAWRKSRQHCTFSNCK